jgi:hypothetical protein
MFGKLTHRFQTGFDEKRDVAVSVNGTDPERGHLVDVEGRGVVDEDPAVLENEVFFSIGKALFSEKVNVHRFVASQHRGNGLGMISVCAEDGAVACSKGLPQGAYVTFYNRTGIISEIFSGLDKGGILRALFFRGRKTWT